MNGMQAVTDLALYLSKKINDVAVFKIEKPVNYTLPYICLNYLSILYGSWVNTSCIVNVNIHVPDLNNGMPDTLKLQQISQSVMELIPPKNTTTEDDERELIINGSWYHLEADSNCIKDVDNTHFVNFRVQVTFTN